MDTSDTYKNSLPYNFVCGVIIISIYMCECCLCVCVLQCKALCELLLAKSLWIRTSTRLDILRLELWDSQATHITHMFITYFQVVWMYFMCYLPCERVNCCLCHIGSELVFIVVISWSAIAQNDWIDYASIFFGIVLNKLSAFPYTLKSFSGNNDTCYM